MRRPILHHMLQGDAVYDPFLGNGTTMIAAEMTGRSCYGTSWVAYTINSYCRLRSSWASCH
ncbi:DNA methyltransferase [Bradyrhizobium liaoningense]|uniref:DNA methyltransferase n=1 Tax=Bradyrhizobium liaoningense TaxID=43992 RepID=UPI003908B7EE